METETSEVAPSSPSSAYKRRILSEAEDGLVRAPTVETLGGSNEEEEEVVKVGLSSVVHLSSGEEEDEDDFVAIHDDVYNMFFLSNVCGQAFFYASYVFLLKMALYTFLALDAMKEEQPDDLQPKVLAAQFLMLPIAVAMQEDLIATYFLIANVKFSTSLIAQNPGARQWKYNVANFARGVDGLYSLLVNFIILIKATRVLPMFLNFAALQFLQTIDNLALQLAESGFLTERLETVAKNVQEARLPQKTNQYVRALDTILFLATFAMLLIAWIMVNFV